MANNSPGFHVVSSGLLAAWCEEIAIMAIYDLYGSLLDDIDEARSRLELSFGIEFEAHDSAYQGEYFQWGKTSSEHFVLKRNVDPLDDEPAETAFPGYRMLLYVNDTARAADLRAGIEQANGFVLLRHEDLE